MLVRKNNLLLIACLVWAIAGINILKIGIISYRSNVSFIHIVYSILVFAIFQKFVFGKLVKKHTRRILKYKENKQFFFKFFDIKSFLIMAFMMTFGILIRVFKLMPQKCIALFYSGLGFSLLFAGILFGFNYVKTFKYKN